MYDFVHLTPFCYLLLFFHQSDTSIDFLRPTRKLHLTNGNKTLRISNVTTDDNGLYSCSAINSIGESKMDFSIDVLLPQTAKRNESRNDGDRNKSETSLLIPSGASMLINCPIDRREPELPIFWMRNTVNATEILSNEVTLVSYEKRKKNNFLRYL